MDLINKYDMFLRLHELFWEDIDKLIQYCDSGYSQNIDIKTFKRIEIKSSNNKIIIGAGSIDILVSYNNDCREKPLLSYSFNPMSGVKIRSDRFNINFVYRRKAYSFRRNKSKLDSNNKMIISQLQDNTDRFINEKQSLILRELEKIYE